MILAPKNNSILTYQQTRRESYLPHTNKQHKIVVDYVWDVLLKGEAKEVKALFGIIHKQTEIYLKRGKKGYAPLPWETLRDKGYINALKSLKELDSLEWTGYTKPVNGKAGVCRKYRLRLDIFFELASLNPARVDTYMKKGFTLYNLITGKAIRKVKTERHEIYKYNKRKKQHELIVSDIVAKGIVPIKYCLFDAVTF